MADYQNFVPPYQGGWQNNEAGDTPITADILNDNYDAYLLSLNAWAITVDNLLNGIPDELAELTGDVLISNPLTDQVLKYNATTHMWYNGTDETGSTVTFSQIQASGTKIATITIDGTSYDIYAPNGGSGGGDTVTWTQLQSTGTKIATITINGTSTDVYIPALPTKTSDLTNDSNFVSDASYVHTDNNYTTTEKNKLADLNEVVANPQSGTSAGDLSSISIGGTKYDIPSGGGGGTTVIANPSGEATVELEKLQVGSTIYSIPEGGSGGSYTEDILYSATSSSAPPDTLTLSHSYTDYDILIFNLNRYADNTYDNKYDRFILVSDLSVGDRIQLTTYTEYCTYEVTNSTTFTRVNLNAVYLEKVVGIKFGSGEGTTVVANPSEEATDDLTKVQIGSTVYDISSGGSSDYIDVVGKLTAGSTSITLNSPKIKTSSCVFPWTSVFGLAPTNMVVQNGSVTLTFPAQQSDVDVMVRVTKLNTGHTYDIDLSTLQLNKSWLYYDANKSSVNDTGDGLQLSGDDADNSWTTSATVGINIANMIGTVPSGLTALKLHFKIFEMEGYTGVRFINSNTLYTGQTSGSDAILRTNGFYQFENNNSSIDEDNYEITVPCMASDLTNSYLYIMFFDGMVAGNTSGYSNSLNGSYNIIIDGIDFVTGGNS